jgi:N-acylglucosamine-6-phosphate 2-epimerase
VSYHAPIVDARLAALAGGLVVSCQAPQGSPLRSPEIMLAMARAAIAGGAVGIRANGPDHVGPMVAALDVPVLGLHKVDYDGSPVYITPTPVEVEGLLATGCRMIALDATDRPRPGGAALADLVRRIHDAGALAFGDLTAAGDLESAVAAGIDAVGTTLSGYTTGGPVPAGPDFELLALLARRSTVPVYAEGRYGVPDEAGRAIALGADLVIIGTAITEPIALTRRFVAALGAGPEAP